MHSAASSQPHSNTILRSLWLTQTANQNANSIPGSPGINVDTTPYCYWYRLLLCLNPLTPNTNTMCPVVPMQTPPTPTNHITTTMQPPPSHGGFPGPGKPRTLSLIPPSCSRLLGIPAQRYLWPLGSINHIATTTGPRPSHGGGYPPLALQCLHTTLLITHQPITVHTLALSKEEGERGARPLPQILPTTHPPVLKQ